MRQGYDQGLLRARAGVAARQPLHRLHLPLWLYLLWSYYLLWLYLLRLYLLWLYSLWLYLLQPVLDEVEHGSIY